MKAKEDKFWDIIEACEWAKDNNYDRIREFLIKLFSLEERKELVEFCRLKRNQLYARFEEWGRTQVPDDGYEHRGCNYFPVSDDGLSDLTAHIVGCGETEFKRVMKNPELAKERADNGAYYENFFYSFHFDDIP